MRLILKKIYFFISYLYYKYRYKSFVVMNGFSIIYAHKGASIHFFSSNEGRKITINSSEFSNLIGISQRTIISCRDGGIINIGPGVGISGSTIYSLSEINIGKNTIIGSGCKIVDNDFHSLNPELRINQKDSDIKRAPICIGDNCFIGMHSIILKGTTLGNNCIVGASSVVHGTFPDNVIIAGNPAKIIKYIVE